MLVTYPGRCLRSRPFGSFVCCGGHGDNAIIVTVISGSHETLGDPPKVTQHLGSKIGTLVGTCASPTMPSHLREGELLWPPEQGCARATGTWCEPAWPG